MDWTCAEIVFNDEEIDSKLKDQINLCLDATRMDINSRERMLNF